jgi:hypothetical protein
MSTEGAFDMARKPMARRKAQAKRARKPSVKKKQVAHERSCRSHGRRRSSSPPVRTGRLFVPGRECNTIGIEAQTKELLDYWKSECNNAWDVIGDFNEIDWKLPQDSALRPEFNAALSEAEEMMASV